ncbi:MAG: efflux RND transporter periplasmic adaptor subunit [Pirellulaceae bacterium]
MATHAFPSRDVRAPRTSQHPLVRLLKYLASTVPTLLVLAALAGIAWVGHRFDWKLPKYSTLFQPSAGAPTEAEFCDEHAVAEGDCIECHPKLAPKPKDFGWCAEHGITQCVYHHPELAQLKTTYVPTPADSARIATALAARPRPLNNSRCTLHQRRIQFSSQAAIDKAGVEIAVAQEQPMVESIPANGHVAYRNGSVAHLGSRVAGNVLRIERQVGDAVQAGDLLATVDSVEVGKAKEALVQSIVRARADRVSYDNLSQLPEGAIAGSKIRAAKTALDVAESAIIAAEQVLANLGLPVDRQSLGEGSPNQLMARLRLLGLEEHTFETLLVAPSSNLFPVRASQAGTLVEVDAVAGEAVDSQSRMFVIADTRKMTGILQVPAEEASYLQIGQAVEFQLDGARERKKGSIRWISPEMDPKTRTVQIRTELDNDDARLRANAFGTGHILLREEPRAIVVPATSLQWEGDCNVVFVRTRDYFQKDAPKFFIVRKVVPGVKTADGVEIISGVLPGEVVAAKGSDVLRAELLKSNLGDGECCGAHGHAH